MNRAICQLSADCFSATPVCTPVYNVPSLNPFPSNTIPNEIPIGNTCLSNGEVNGVWYTFTVQDTGILNFSIIPANPSDDYDWALFDLTNNPCSDIAINPTLDISCNYSNSINNNGITGANGGPNNQDEPVIPVVAGQTFVLFISNYSGSTNGYQLNFSNSTATIPDGNIPTMDSFVPSDSCGATSVFVTFSENIACNSLSPADFTLTGPGGNIPIASINCGAQYAETIEVVLGGGMSIAGNYTLTLTGSVSDICGNALTGPVSLDIFYNAISANIVVVDATCGNNDGSATAVVIGGHAPFDFLWSNGQTGNSASGLPRGHHTVTITDSIGCTVTLGFDVNDPTSFTFTIAQTPDTCNEGNGVLDVNVVGTTAPYNYNFVGFQNGASDVYGNAIGDSSYVVIVTDNLGCWWPDTITVLNILNDSLHAFYSVSDHEVDFLWPYASFYNMSQNETTVEWFIDGQTLYGNSFQYEFNNYGDFPVSIVAIDNNGCRDTFTMTITVKVILSLFIPNAITTNDDGLNEVFYVKGIGMDSTTFELSIFDHFGREIFHTSDLTQGWDGRPIQQNTNNNPQDVYVYRVFVRDIYGDPYVRTGSITVIR